MWLFEVKGLETILLESLKPDDGIQKEKMLVYTKTDYLNRKLAHRRG